MTHRPAPCAWGARTRRGACAALVPFLGALGCHSALPSTAAAPQTRGGASPFVEAPSAEVRTPAATSDAMASGSQLAETPRARRPLDSECRATALAFLQAVAIEDLTGLSSYLLPGGVAILSDGSTMALEGHWRMRLAELDYADTPEVPAEAMDTANVDVESGDGTLLPALQLTLPMAAPSPGAPRLFGPRLTLWCVTVAERTLIARTMDDQPLP